MLKPRSERAQALDSGRTLSRDLRQSIRIGLGHGRGVAHLGLAAPSLAEPAISSFGRPYIVARCLYLPLQAQGDAHETEKGCLWAHLPVDRPHQILADGVISDDWDPDLGINGAP